MLIENFSFSSKCSLISLKMFPFTHEWFTSVVFTLHVFGDFPVIFCIALSLSSVMIREHNYTISMLLHLFRFFYEGSMCVEKNVSTAVLVWSVGKMSAWLHSVLSVYQFCRLLGEVLKSPAVILDFSIFLFNSVSSCSCVFLKLCCEMHVRC